MSIIRGYVPSIYTTYRDLKNNIVLEGKVGVKKRSQSIHINKKSLRIQNNITYCEMISVDPTSISV